MQKQNSNLKTGENQVTFESGTPDDNNEMSEVEAPRRATRERRQTEFYGERASVAGEVFDEPSTYSEAVSSSSRKEWQAAMQKEMKSIYDNDVWDLVELPAGRKLVGSKWVFKVKRDADGNMERCKARLVARGFTQKYGVDYDETFSPVIRFESFRALVALAVKHGLQLHQMDVNTAFLHGVLEEDVYMKQPEGFERSGEEHMVCKLKKSLYGLKQSPRCWNTALDQKLQ